MILTKYSDFIQRVQELGYMTLSTVIPGLPSLSDETPKDIWHTGDPETDPWCWKDRAADEKKLAFGCIIGGQKGFVSEGMYASFYKAYQPEEHMEERRLSGVVSQTVWDLWMLFEKKTLLSTSDIRQEIGVTQKEGGSKVDRAIIELQKLFYLTVAGNRRKTNKLGQPFGWPANVYDRPIDWAPDHWLKHVDDISVEEAREKILLVGIKAGRELDRYNLKKVLFR